MRFWFSLVGRPPWAAPGPRPGQASSFSCCPEAGQGAGSGPVGAASQNFMKILPALLATAFLAQAQEPLRLVQTIPMPGVTGRIDHLSIDLKRERLFVAALGNNTVEVLDLRAGKRLHSITGLQEPQGLIYLPELNKLFVASGGDGTCKSFDGELFKLLDTIKFPDDADNIRYDLAARLLYVGYGKGALGIADPAKAARVGDIELGGHPESFQLEKSGSRIFVNVPTAKHIAVIDRHKRTVLAKWPITQAAAHFPMALDETNHRLFAGCRKPPKVLVFDTTSGKLVAELASTGDADDLFYDAARKRLYVSGGEGFISVFRQHGSDQYQSLAKLATRAGARTSLFVPESSRLYLAVPQREGKEAEVRGYEVK